MIVTVSNNLEGVGRSTIAVNSAVMRSLVGHSVVLIDIDPKKASFEWSEARKRAGILPHIPACSIKSKHLKSQFAELSANYIDVVIDTDWRDTTGNATALELSDMVIVPITPGEGSVDNLKEMVRRIKIARRTNPNLWTLIVIVRAPKVVPLFELDAIRNYVGKLPATTLVGTIIRDHQSVQLAFAEHLSIFEYKPADARAIAEMHDLYRAHKMRRAVLPSISRLQRCA